MSREGPDAHQRRVQQLLRRHSVQEDLQAQPEHPASQAARSTLHLVPPVVQQVPEPPEPEAQHPCVHGFSAQILAFSYLGTA